MDWIHCNHCYCQPGESDRKFMITGCGHLFCTQCCNYGEEMICLLCHTKCSSILIASGMAKSVEHYFSEPEKTIKEVMEITAFQQGHRHRYVKFLREKYTSQKREILVFKEEIKRHRDEKNKLKRDNLAKIEEIQRLKNQLSLREQQLSQAKQSTPRNVGSQQQYFSASPTSQANKQFNSQMGSGRTFGTQLQNILSGSQSAASKAQEFFFNSNFNDSGSPKVNNENNSTVFTPPQAPFQNAYRGCSSSGKSMTPQSRTPPAFLSPSSSEGQRSITQQRKVFLPGDKGSSPLNKIGLQRLSLKCVTPSFHRNAPSPTVKIANRVPRPTPTHSANKYNKYF